MEKNHTTNYRNAFIEVAADCKAHEGVVPQPRSGTETVATLQFKMIKDHPYRYTSDDVIFETYAIRNQIPKENWPEARKEFFSKGQACMRASPLTKTFGWGVHCDEQGRIAIYAVDSPEYERFQKDAAISHPRAMATKRG